MEHARTQFIDAVRDFYLVLPKLHEGHLLHGPYIVHGLLSSRENLCLR